MDKPILITGATAGIGLEAAKSLAGAGAHVVLACRSREKAEAAVAEIEAVEAKQKERSAALADPEVYADHARKSQLLNAYGEAAERLDDLTASWEVKSSELETLEG